MKHQKHSILITGGTGFAGSHLVEYLSEIDNFDIHVTSFSSSASFVSQILKPSQIHTLDLTNKIKVNQLIKKIKPKQVYHLASISQVGSSFDQAEKVLSTNTLITLNLLESIKKFCPQTKILLVGSAQEYDLSSPKIKSKSKLKIDENWQLGPNNPYGVSKVIQDLLSLSMYYAHGLQVIRVRPFNHIGERQSQGFVTSDFAQNIIQIEKNIQKNLRVGNLNAIRDFTDVKDMVRAYYLVMNQGQVGAVYNIGSGQGYSIKQILGWMVGFSSAPIKIVASPDLYRPLDTPHLICDNSRIKKLGWQPQIPIKNTLKRILDYWRNYL